MQINRDSLMREVEHLRPLSRFERLNKNFAVYQFDMVWGKRRYNFEYSIPLLEFQERFKQGDIDTTEECTNIKNNYDIEMISFTQLK